MSDRMSAEITIGGQLKKAHVSEFLEAIKAESPSLEYGGEVFAPATAKALLKARVRRRLCLYDTEAPWGQFDEIETVCRELGLSYTRHSDGKYEYDAEVVEWRPGMAEPFTFLGANGSNHKFVSLDEVEKALEHLEAGRTDKARSILQELCPEIPEVPPFEVI